MRHEGHFSNVIPYNGRACNRYCFNMWCMAIMPLSIGDKADEGQGRVSWYC